MLIFKCCLTNPDKHFVSKGTNQITNFIIYKYYIPDGTNQITNFIIYKYYMPDGTNQSSINIPLGIKYL